MLLGEPGSFFYSCIENLNIKDTLCFLCYIVILQLVLTHFCFFFSINNLGFEFSITKIQLLLLFFLTIKEHQIYNVFGIV
jgi:hypothetical protein